MRVLVYMRIKELAPVGGPRGYNYNLWNSLKKSGVVDIEYIDTDEKDLRNEVNKVVNRIKMPRIRNVLSICKSIVNRMLIIYGKSKKPCVSLDRYDIVHFHNPLDMYMIRDSLSDYKGKLLLTSHSPVLSSDELIDTASEFEKKYLIRIYKQLKKVDIYAFERADHIIFPCQEAEEPYYHSWDYYKEFKEKNRKKYKYLLTGIEQCKANTDRRKIREIYGIPDEAFVISYVGRHNVIKGYDNLKEICRRILSDYKKVYVLVAGKEGPLYGLQDERWIEVGWTNDPHSIIAASDVFLLPNKETYFDLILLEVISLGKIVIASSTGGNKYFEQIKEKGIFLYETEAEAAACIEKVIAMNDYEKRNLEQANLSLYLERFTCEVFTKKYLQILQEIENQNT